MASSCELVGTFVKTEQQHEDQTDILQEAGGSQPATMEATAGALATQAGLGF